MPAESVVGAVAVGAMDAVVAGIGAGVMSMSALEAADVREDITVAVIVVVKDVGQDYRLGR